jgi:hypothetical protein
VSCLSAAVRHVLLVRRVVNGPDAGPMGDAVTAALALLGIRPPQ